MKKVNCKDCKRELGEIDGDINNLSVTFNEGITVTEPHVSVGLFVATFICPDCKTSQNEVAVIK